MMTDRFDPQKNATNQAKHRLPLSYGNRIFDDDDHIIVPSIRPEDEEERFKVVGRVDAKLYTGVFVWRDGLAWFISVRRSNKGEERSYRSAG